jgi:Fuc2NAc and GlcNAc transferase
MRPWAISGLCAATMLASWALTRVFLSYAVARGMLDVPNERSSHVQPTPRGGGAAIALTTSAALCILAVAGTVSRNFVLGFCGAGGVVAVVGFLDDRNHLKRRWRLLAHVAAASILLTTMGRIGPVTVFGNAVSGWAMWPIGILYVVWIINLTNFMDGIDGLAASEAVTVAGGGTLLFAIGAPLADAWTVAVVFAAAAAGFLIWNCPPARVFMGDVGSGFVGVALAALSLQALTISASLFWGWIILMGAFVVDASMTLIRRMWRGERVYDAHRTHAYQHAAVRWRTHGGVTLAAVAINLFWLLPLACLVALDRINPIVAVGVAYTPLIAAGVWLGAGAPALAAQTRSTRGSTGENVGR